ncbi:hypothetical protein JRG66_06285 [Salinimicrobium tongyeongense]|uniref:Uncharacterized protein n=1 Tax=Salinimicrobium tongyeongense TaxID=2809707 RepID=A0ABY6NU76_9FLAO|nr:hypothetical protein [Salinimicrobium tongyeongense]UZH56465.1 hypothetical protein JRG66_06285 [Salinimicrobium tongyeongense]
MKYLLLLILLIPFSGIAQDISGSWFWQAENDGPRMEIILKAEGAGFTGHHCAVFENSDKIDCVDQNDTVSIKIKRTAENKFEGTIRSGYSGKKEKVKLLFDPNKKILLFEIREAPGSIYYLPKRAFFKSTLGRESKSERIISQSETTDLYNPDHQNEPSLQNLKSSEKIKDSLFFHLNESYFQKGKYDENLLYSKDALKDEGSSETFLFKIMERRSDIAAPEKIGSFHQYITGSEFFQEEKKVNKLQDYRLASHLQKFIIYLVDYNYEPPMYIRVYPLTEIE